VEYVTQFNISVTRAFTPHLTHLYAREELAATRRLFLIGTRFSGLLSFPLAACLFVFGHAFLRLWIGPGYVTGPLGQRSDIVMAVLLLTYMPQWQQSISRQLLLASGKYRFLMYQQVVQAVANVVLSLLLIRWYGVIGVAAAKVVPGAVSDLVVIPVHVLRRLNIPLRQYVREGVARALLVGVALFAFTWPLVRLWNPAFSWKVLFLQVGVSLLVYGILGWTIGLTAQDRQLARERLASVLGRLRPVPRRESLQP
jgi:O-antigen/teichoic acid export membrane protein